MTAETTTAEAGTRLDGPRRWLDAYRLMARIRAFEHRVDDLYKRALMPGLTHLYVGEEAVAVGVCSALRVDDQITSTHRGHGHCIAKGASVDRMFAELLGKAEGYCRGKGGSMHIADHARGNLGANAIVGGSAGIATGAALSARMQGTDRVVVCFFGDGALGQGLLYESMNMAALWKLPVLFVCENNGYGQYTALDETLAGDISARPAAFGIPCQRIDGQDVRAVSATTADIVARMRAGEGPAFLVCDTYRWYGHHVGDVDRTSYRTKEEEREWREQRDPLRILADWVVASGEVPAAELERIVEEEESSCEAGAAWAIDAPFPAASEVDDHVFAEG